MEVDIANEQLIIKALYRIEHMADQKDKAYRTIFEPRNQNLFVKIMSFHDNNEKIQLFMFDFLEKCLGTITDPNKNIKLNTKKDVFQTNLIEQFFYIFLVS